MYTLATQNDAHAAQSFSRFRLLFFVVPLLAMWLFTGCQSTELPAQAPSVPTEATVAVAAAEEATAQETIGTAADSDTRTEAVEPAESEVAAEAGAPPMRMAIPAIAFVAEVEPMAWRVTEVDDERQAVWEVPENSAGWHINSATPGTAGNMILSGHHLIGAAVFAPFARGEVALDDQILVTDATGQTFVYQVSALADPIPVTGATEAERDRINAYYAPSDQAKLTLITGWPDFSDTHYLFVIADFIGELE